MTSTTDGPYGRRRAPPANGETTTVPLSRYDLVLALIPVAFLLAVVAGTVLSVSIPTAIAGASLLGLAAIVEGVYRNPPVTGH